MKMFNCLIGIILSITCYQSVLAASPQVEKFISVSDIHFNPFSACSPAVKTCETLNKLRAASYKDWDAILIQDGEDKISKTGQDTNYPLFASTAETLQQVNQAEQPQFGLILGDFLAHQFHAQYIAYSHDTSAEGYSAFVKKTLQFMTYKLHQAMPNTNIYTVVGNNDSYNGNYYSVPNGLFYQETAATWADLINDPAGKKQLLTEFPAAGYYAVTLPGTHNRLILLNTILFSSRAEGKNINGAAQQELVWLHQQLVAAHEQKQHVIIAFHIPPGIDIHNTLKNKSVWVMQYWKPPYQKIFLQELKNNAEIIIGLLPGHLHMDTFQLLKASPESLSLSFTPGISPIFGNNPGFKVYKYNLNVGVLQNFDTYYLPLSNDTGWQKEYSFNHMYQPQCKDCNIVKGMQKLGPKNELVGHFKQYYAVGSNSEYITKNNDWMPYYWCNLSDFSTKEYRQCVKRN